MTSRFAKRVWDPTLLAELRCRYEQTSETVTAIAASHDIPRTSFRALIHANGWQRRGAGRPPPESSAEVPSAPPASDAPEAVEGLVARLEQAVAREISALEASHAGRVRKPEPAADTERIVRSLERLTDTLAKVRRMREPAAATDPDDDLPRDLDEFRRVLARRIEQLVGRRADEDDAGDPAADGAAEAG
ncbi:hypothetical protein [Rhodoplanes roseus]|uniref:Uncharacterized protein n=1 Tax=Rhodoplanes roseus TaxID=29409 RepID=A0A327L0W9_9BRAD|nr:hypothetical protein [Rhodoplanes roseus]RAI44101.1 hypothetical protein CH341_10980 [Rhodoplanes roseus]